MTHSTRRLLIAVATLALAAAACGPGVEQSPPPSISPSPSIAPTASVTPPASPTTSSETTTAPSNSPAPSASTAASSGTACAVVPSSGQLPSDRLVDLKVATSGTADQLTFVFGNMSLPGPAAPPQGSLSVAEPPYTQAGSGAAIDLVGDHAVQIRFTGMSITNDAGEEVYQGPPELRPDFGALRHAVLYDASEGVVGWYVGYDGPGCVTLTRTGNDVVVTIAHG